jgi:hypothetical protein
MEGQIQTTGGFIAPWPATNLRTRPAQTITKLIATVVLNGLLNGAALAQGTVNFFNVNAPVYLSDGTTPLNGPQYMAGLMAGPTANSLALIATTPFFTNGYYLGGLQTINSVQGGDIAFIQVDVWNTATGTTFDQAQASGFGNAWAQSSVFTVQTGSNLSVPPIPPTSLFGLTPLSLNAGPPIPAQLSMLRQPVGTGTGTNTPAAAQWAMVLTWSDPTFSLQASANAAGIYTNVVGAASPYTNNIAGSALFFRLIAN